MATSASSTELAHQLALRVHQLCALEQALRELRIARHLPGNPFPSSEASLSDLVMHMLLLSMLYSIFDQQRESVDIRDLKPKCPEFEAELAELVEKWTPLKEPIRRIRHKFAFHGSATKADTRVNFGDYVSVIFTVDLTNLTLTPVAKFEGSCHPRDLNEVAALGAAMIRLAQGASDYNATFGQLTVELD